MNLNFEELPRLIDCRLEPAILRGEIGCSSIDTRLLKPGEIFWALQGEKNDGHLYVAEAFRKGARAAVVGESWFRSNKEKFADSSFIIVPDPLNALQNLAAAYRRRFKSASADPFGIPVIALTGSNGKTATKEMLAAALSSKYRTLKSEGNFNNHIGVPLTLLRIASDTEMVLTEMGTNHPGEMERLCSIAGPEVGLVLNVATAHLEGFGNVDEVAKEKAVLLGSLPSSGTAFINVDDPFVRKMATPARTSICYGFTKTKPKSGCSQFLRGIALPATSDGKGRLRFLDTVINLNWFGRHHLANALAASAVAHYFGVGPSEIARIFSELPPIPGRLNVEKIGGVTLIDDTYNANPASTVAALDFLESITVSGEEYVVLGDHLELGDSSEKEHRRIGRMLRKGHIKGIFLIGKEMQFARQEVSNRVIAYAQNPDDLEVILSEILGVIKAGDAVLVKASRSMRLERVVHRIKRHFSGMKS